MGRLTLFLKSGGIGLAILATLTLSHTTAKADEVFVSGFTNGCFLASCTPGASATILGLTYSNSTFSGTTAGGFRALGGNANPGSNFNNLGSLSLSTAPNTYNAPFTLQVTFSAPQGLNGSNVVTFVASITGVVRSDNTGGAFVDFGDTPVLFTWNDTNCEANPEAQPPAAGNTTCGTGSFFFKINDVSIDPGQTVSVTGQITGAQQTSSAIPEPTSMLLFGTGLVGAAGFVRKRRRRK